MKPWELKPSELAQDVEKFLEEYNVTILGYSINKYPNTFPEVSIETDKQGIDNLIKVIDKKSKLNFENEYAKIELTTRLFSLEVTCDEYKNNS